MGSVAAVVLLAALMAGSGLLMAPAPRPAVSPYAVAPVAAEGTGSPAAPAPAYSGSGWLNISSASTPPDPRIEATSAYDAADGYLLLFGGDTGSTTVAETWSYQNGTWTDISSGQNQTPGPRYLSMMTYDAQDREVVLFGGYNLAGSGNSSYLSDTWAFHGGQWHPLAPKTHPSARDRAAMAYDAADGYVVLYGGTNSAGAALGDTWKFVGGNWTNLSASVSGSPPTRYRASMVDDVADGELVLFGGTTATGSSAGSHDTWTYSDLAWTQASSSKYPPSRVYEFLGYDPADSAVVLYGGAESSNGIGLGDTWTFSDGQWTNVSSSVGSAPSSRAYGTFSFDPVGDYLVLNGGANGPQTAFYSDTWAFGLEALVSLSASPPATDVDVATAIHTSVVSGATNLSYAYYGLPPGCASANVATLSCRPTKAGSYSLEAVVTLPDANSSSANLSMLVRPDPAIASFAPTPSQVTVGARTVLQTVVSGGTGRIAFAYPALPPGCSGASVANLSCRPIAAGTFPLEVVVTDQVGGTDNRSSTLTVAPVPTVQGFESVPATTDYGATVLLYANVSGGTAPFSYSWSSLPNGCTAANVSPLPCRPQILGAATVYVKVSDRFGDSVNGTISLLVNPDPRLVSAGLAQEAADVSGRITAYANVTGGSTPFTFAYSGGPSGCAFPSLPKSTCSPGAPGTYTIRVAVTDAAGFPVNGTVGTIVVAPAPQVVSSSALPASIDVGQATTIRVVTSGGSLPFAFAYSGLPGGCASADTGNLSCAPTLDGTFSISVSAVDAVGGSATATVRLLVGPTLRLAGLTVEPADVQVGQAVVLTATVAAYAGTPPYSFHYTGLPPGCPSADQANLSCTPSASGSFVIDVAVTDAAGARASATANLTVSPAPSSNGLLGLSGTEAYGLGGGIVVVAVAVLLLVLLRARRRPSAPAGSPEGPAPEPGP
jgi:hypothetical protein